MMSNKGTKDWGAGEKSRLELGHVLFRRNQINLPIGGYINIQSSVNHR